MLSYIYARLVIVLEWLGKISRSSEALETRLRRIEQIEKQNALLLEFHTILLEEIRGSVVPGQATQVTLMAGPTEEQP